MIRTVAILGLLCLTGCASLSGKIGAPFSPPSPSASDAPAGSPSTRPTAELGAVAAQVAALAAQVNTQAQLTADVRANAALTGIVYTSAMPFGVGLLMAWALWLFYRASTMRDRQTHEWDMCDLERRRKGA